ncbi:MAG: hypothetical protein ACOZNI_23000 [Myxococcota bacterium]
MIPVPDARLGAVIDAWRKVYDVGSTVSPALKRHGWDHPTSPCGCTVNLECRLIEGTDEHVIVGKASRKIAVAKRHEGR